MVLNHSIIMLELLIQNGQILLIMAFYEVNYASKFGT